MDITIKKTEPCDATYADKGIAPDGTTHDISSATGCYVHVDGKRHGISKLKKEGWTFTQQRDIYNPALIGETVWYDGCYHSDDCECNCELLEATVGAIENNRLILRFAEDESVQSIHIGYAYRIDYDDLPKVEERTNDCSLCRSGSACVAREIDGTCNAPRCKVCDAPNSAVHGTCVHCTQYICKECNVSTCGGVCCQACAGTKHISEGVILYA